MFDSRRQSRLVAVVLSIGLAAASAGAATAQTWRTVSSARQEQGEKILDVRVQYGAGTLRIEPARTGLLYRFEMRYNQENMRPLTEYDRAAGRLRLGHSSLEGSDRRSKRGGGTASVALSPTVPLDLQLRFGAGEAHLDLGGLSLRGLELATGASDTRVRFGTPNRIQADRVHITSGAASLDVSGLGNARARRFEFEGGVGETTLDFGGAWTRDATATVKLGIGSVRLRVPRSLGVRVEKDSFLTSFDADGMVKRGGAYYSRNWSSAEHKLTVEINAAFGSVDIDWVD